MGPFTATLCLAVSLLLALVNANGVLAASSQHGSRQFRELEVQDPRTELESEGGRLEMWSGSVLEDAKVAAWRTTLKPRGLWLPSYVDVPAVHVVTRGGGRVGIISPLAEHVSGESSFKVQKGDVVAVPQGVSIWWYNDGEKDLEIFGGADLSSEAPGQCLRAFHLAGGRQQDPREGEKGGQQQQKGYGAVLHGFNVDTLSRAWEVKGEDVRQILRSQGGSGIVKVAEQIDFPAAEEAPSTANVFTSASFVYRLGTAPPDVRAENGGELRELNSFKLPVLRHMDLGIQCMQLDKDAMVAPSWFHNAHQLLYVVGGRGKVEVVSHRGEKALDAEVEQGSVVLIPSLYPSAKLASLGKGFHYISIVTSHRPIVSYLTGSNSVYQGIPLGVVSRALNVGEEQASRIQRARNDQAVILPSNKQHAEGRAAWSVV